MAAQRRYLEMFLEEGAEILSKLDQQILQIEKAPGDSEALQSALRLVHTLKGGAKMVGLDKVSRAAHGIETLLEERYEGGPVSGRVDATPILAILDQIRAVLTLLSEGRVTEAMEADLSADRSLPASALHATPEPGAAAPAEMRLSADRVRVSVERLDALQNLVDDLVLQRVKIQNHFAIFRRAFLGLERVGREEGDRDFTPKERDIVRRVVRLLSGRGFRDYMEDLHLLERITGELQELVLDLRMVPLAELLEEYHRTVRDLAKELGKEVVLAVDGGFTEVDKHLLEAIQAPLTHLVRNAVDHGIEPGTERRAAGKPPCGQVTIRAYQKNTAVVIDVEDDGRGLDPERIRERAVEEGFLTAEEARSASDEEIFYVLCEPGFSTRSQLTEVSGRGVGLDAVKVQLEKLKGSLAIQSQLGAFTRFRMFLPISISTLPALIVRVGSMHCALPTLFVDRCVRGDSTLLAERAATIAHGDRALPVVSLARILGEPVDEVPRSVQIVILRFRGRAMALQVDALEQERVVVLKNLGEHLKGVPYVLGVSFLADEQPVPVVNVVDLYARWPTLEMSCGFRPPERTGPAVVLVVDDSLPARHMEETILEGLGYRVVQASNGEEAWSKLHAHPVDLVLTDVEMPAMDGLELTRRLRASPRLGSLPVVVVFNRVGERDLESSLLAGADAYLRKDQLNQRELRATLSGLLGKRSPSTGDAGRLRIAGHGRAR